MPATTPMAPNILLVDDDELFRSSVEDALRAAEPSYRIHVAGNGKQALAKFERHPADIVVTDLSMPKMDGLEMLLAIRHRGYRGPTLVVTAFGDEELKQKVSYRGAFYYLDKPVDLAELITTIRKIAQNRLGSEHGLTVAGLSHLIQIARRSGVLRIKTPKHLGQLLFHNGELLQAKVGKLVGPAAARLLLELDPKAELDFVSDAKMPRNREKDPDLAALIERQARPTRDNTDTQDPNTAKAAHPGAAAERLKQKEYIMSNVKESLAKAMEIDGAIGVCLVDHESGMSLGQEGGGDRLNLEVAAAGNTRVVNAKLTVMESLGLNDKIEDILISLGSQYHLIRPLEKISNLFLYLALDRKKANLAMARHQLSTVETGLQV